MRPLPLLLAGVCLSSSLQAGPLTTDAYLLEHDSFVWRHKWAMLRSGKLQRVRLLVLGDSQAMSGIKTDLVASKLGLQRDQIYNFGLPAQQPEGLLDILPLLHLLPDLKVVLVNIDKFNTAPGPVFQVFQKYHQLEFYDPFCIARSASGWRACGNWLRGLSLIRLRSAAYPFFAFSNETVERAKYEQDRRALDEIVRSPWAPWPAMQQRMAQNKQLEVRLFRDNGFWVWKSFGETSCDATLPTMAGPLPTGLREGATRAYNRLFSALREHSLRVVALELPLAPLFPDQSWAPWLAALDAPPPLWTTSPFSNAAFFHDLTHLSTCGAVHYSQWLAEKIRTEVTL